MVCKSWFVSHVPYNLQSDDCLLLSGEIMLIKVCYFASLKDKIGRSEEQLECANAITVTDIWHQVNHHKTPLNNILVAVNMEYVAFDCVVYDGDEVAFFPMVTGG